MTTTPYPGAFYPDSPAQRLPWTVLSAALLVLLALAGFGHILKTLVRPAPELKPLQARIYELPASPGVVAPKPTAHPHARSYNQPAQQHSREQTHPRPEPHAHPLPHAQPAELPRRNSQATLPKAQVKKGVALAPSRQTPNLVTDNAAPSRHEALPPAAPRPEPTSPQPPPDIDWARLQSQINALAGQAATALPQFHDPHTLIARYYIAAVMQKLQRIGDMNYPGDLTGEPVLGLEIGADGQLLHLTLLRSSGNDALDSAALGIARESAPFSPFPSKLEHQTRHISLVFYMSFEGHRHIYTGY